MERNLWREEEIAEDCTVVVPIFCKTYKNTACLLLLIVNHNRVGGEFINTIEAWDVFDHPLAIVVMLNSECK